MFILVLENSISYLQKELNRERERVKEGEKNTNRNERERKRENERLIDRTREKE